MSNHSYKDAWTLYIPSICPPSQPAAYFLATYLATKSLPENYRPNMLVTMTTNSVTSGNYPLRGQLLDWLLPNIEDMRDGGHVIAVQCVDHVLLAQVSNRSILNSYY